MKIEREERAFPLKVYKPFGLGECCGGKRISRLMFKPPPGKSSVHGRRRKTFYSLLFTVLKALLSFHIKSYPKVLPLRHEYQ